jgi:hypothetical protein
LAAALQSRQAGNSQELPACFFLRGSALGATGLPVLFLRSLVGYAIVKFKHNLASHQLCILNG